MSDDIRSAYLRAVAYATDDGNAPGKALSAIADTFDLSGPIGMEATLALFRRMGLVRAPIEIDGARFTVACRYQPGTTLLAWIMPVQQVPRFGADDAELIDLVAFADAGEHAGKVWRLSLACDAVGLDLDAGRRTLIAFRDPFAWLKNWLKACAEDFQLLLDPCCGPEALAALLLDARKICWQQVVRGGIDLVACPGDLGLKAIIDREFSRSVSPPRFVIRKATSEGPHGTSPATA